jgi:hypothetical protein
MGGAPIRDYHTRFREPDIKYAPHAPECMCRVLLTAAAAKGEGGAD